MSDEIRSMIERHTRSVKAKEAETQAAASKRATDERELLRLHADAIEACINGTVEPVLAEALDQIRSGFRATLKKGRTNDPRLGRVQTVIEIELEAISPNTYKDRAPTYRLIYSGDAERGTITIIFDLWGPMETPMGGRNIPLPDISRESVEANLKEFVSKMLKEETTPRPV